MACGVRYAAKTVGNGTIIANKKPIRQVKPKAQAYENAIPPCISILFYGIVTAVA